MKSPRFDFMGITADEAKFAALSIITVEARYASVFGLILEGTPDSISPDGAFDKPFTAKHVLNGVEALHFIQ